MKILVCGGRDYDDRQIIRDWLMFLQDLVPWERLEVVHGGARGADTGAEICCRTLGLKTHVHPALWHLYGSKAGPLRNREMLHEHPDIALVLAFPGGRGTENMTWQAAARKIPVLRVENSPYGIQV